MIFFLLAACLAAATTLLICIAVRPSTASLTQDDPKPATAPLPVSDLAARGRYLTDAGNCISCHTRPGAVPFSGGVPFETPFGTIYSSNITSDPITGIGHWTVEDLRRAMHEGIAADGYRLFPAFPYPEFSKVTDADVGEIYAYLRTLKAVRYSPPKNGLAFSQRWGMMLWNRSFFTEGRFTDDPGQSAEWNRGAYLVQGLGHCGACHTPRNLFMAELADKAYQGGVIQDYVTKDKIRRWSAVNLTSAKDGLGAWSVNDLAKYLQTGSSTRAGTFGPMNEVIVNSLKRLLPEDVKAMAVYLKSLPAQNYRGESVSLEQVKSGESVYKDRCEKCHSASGRGGMFSGPPVVGSSVVQAEDPASLINIILFGPETPKDVSFGSWETMQPYNELLNDSQVAAVCNYVRGSWGNSGSTVTAADVSRQR
jgi:mono/diheme cytochrome c family protein